MFAQEFCFYNFKRYSIKTNTFHYNSLLPLQRIADTWMSVKVPYDCADAQAGLRMWYPQTPEDRFSRVEAHLISVFPCDDTLQSLGSLHAFTMPQKKDARRKWVINPFKPNGISHFYHLDQSISLLRVVGWYFSFSFKF